jgi:hypothetical protein
MRYLHIATDVAIGLACVGISLALISVARARPGEGAPAGAGAELAHRVAARRAAEARVRALLEAAPDASLYLDRRRPQGRYFCRRSRDLREVTP